MRFLSKIFTDHPASVGENYFTHMRSAFGFGWAMLAGGFACLIHGVFPFFFTKSGSKIVTTLHDRMITHRHANFDTHAQSHDKRPSNGYSPG